MRQVVLYQLLSLDGVAEEPGDWMFEGDRAIFDNVERVIGKQDVILLGRRTYEYWVGFWPHDGPEPFHTFINHTPKHVFTSSPLEARAPAKSSRDLVGGERSAGVAGVVA